MTAAAHIAKLYGGSPESWQAAFDRMQECTDADRKARGLKTRNEEYEEALRAPIQAKVRQP